MRSTDGDCLVQNRLFQARWSLGTDAKDPEHATGYRSDIAARPLPTSERPRTRTALRQMQRWPQARYRSGQVSEYFLFLHPTLAPFGIVSFFLLLHPFPSGSRFHPTDRVLQSSPHSGANHPHCTLLVSLSSCTVLPEAILSFVLVLGEEVPA